MRAISQGDNTYDIFDDSLKVYKELPAQSYLVRFSERRGFYLQKYSEMEIGEPKIYGAHYEKVQKVMNAFSAMNRNLGVILSGDKGIGKSLFAKMLSGEAIKNNLPVVVVDTFYPGIASYIEKIEQEIVVLFDEFDKTFGEVQARDGESTPQTQMLSLFDGISSGKKLFVVTCNDLHKLNKYLINRPGRFHYHFRFEYPSVDEIRSYLMDKIDEKYYGEIDKVISFSSRVFLNYDCLRAISFEIQTGISFEDAIKDLNIVNMDSETYDLILRYGNGLVATAKNYEIDMFGTGGDRTYIYLYDEYGNNFVDVSFSPYNAVFDMGRMTYVVQPDKMKLTYDDSDDDYKDLIKLAQSTNVECLEIRRSKKRDIHYLV